MPNPLIINSDTDIDSIEDHFRVFAGPGAGKTYWLVNHIKNVIKKSARLSPASYITCISYTNVAVEEIIGKLGSLSEYVECSTIHSFLYKYVVKPYIHLVKDEDGSPLVNYAEVNGHDEHRPSDSKIKSWLQSVGARFNYYGNKSEVYKYVKKLKWILDKTTGEWNFKTITFASPPQYFPTRSLNSYKQFYWRDGIIDHEDVLYFSYRILDENPIIRELLSQRFPYIFIDEFQDTSPVQTQVVKWLAAETTVVGTIGDVEQSIYSFQGAIYQDFEEFSIDDCITYKIENNRRSTDNIISLLNHVRADELTQAGTRGIEGERVKIYIGEITNVISRIRNDLSVGEILTILARNNDEVSSIRRSDIPENSNLWHRIEQADKDRYRFLQHLVASAEIALQGNLSSAIKRLEHGLTLKTKRRGQEEIRKPFKLIRGYELNEITGIHQRALAVALLEHIITNYEVIKNGSILEAYQASNDIIESIVSSLSLTGVRNGSFKTISESNQYSDLANSISLTFNESRSIRTIHQAKGAQFKNLLVSFNHIDSQRATEQLRHILNPQNFANSEERRITYVALSRAIDNLFISMQTLTDVEVEQLENIGLEVLHVN